MEETIEKLIKRFVTQGVRVEFYRDGIGPYDDNCKVMISKKHDNEQDYTEWRNLIPFDEIEQKLYLTLREGEELFKERGLIK